jgi:hypothetical protein
MIGLGTEMEDNQVYYDISRDGFEGWWVLGVPYIMVIYLIILCFFNVQGGSLLLVGASFAFIAAIFSSVLTWYEFVNSCKALKNGSCRIVEGFVTEHTVSCPEPRNRESESFIVAGKRFFYADNIFVVGFNRTPRNGGKIKNDMNLKVFYLEDRIIRIEIKTSN